MDLLGVESFSPEPSSVTSHGDQVEFEFEGDGDRDVVVTLSGRVPTQQSIGRTRWQIARVHDDSTSPVSMRTVVLP